ncbi:calcium/manganese antiporter SLC30A10 [Planococcus citri]|uniref:calcium/manganese antiporter SLC30A10 n=1 Tax=Planococcus citri TaxID=170843 RepID=UPI0031FA27EF
MALKQWMKKFQPLSLYIVLTLTMFYFLLQLVVSYITHALTLTIDSYLVLCNLIALFGCIITVKNSAVENTPTSTPSESSNSDDSSKSNNSSSQCNVNFITKVPVPVDEKCSSHTTDANIHKRNASERRLRNTFGWARIDVLVMLIGCVVFASLCFSLVIEAVQTLLHISHHDEMHYPIPVFCVGAFGLTLNGLSYLLIGGYTFHHGSFLKVTSSGVVILEDVLSTKFTQNGERRLNLRSHPSSYSFISPGAQEMFRDVIGCVFVMICSTVVYFSDSESAKLADPILAIISAVSLLILSYPYIKESCLILLQTIPDHINIDCLCQQLMKEFPDIINVHDLHVWQFTKGKTFFTAHIIFHNPKVYARVTQNITKFFHDQGITKVTIQPEFYKDDNCLELISSNDSNCLVKCVNPECYERYCCDMHTSKTELKAVLVSKSTINASQTDICLQKTELAISKSSNEISHTSVQLPIPTNNETPPETEETISQKKDESEKNSVSTNELEIETNNIESQNQENSHNSKQNADENEPKSLTTEL